MCDVRLIRSAAGGCQGDEGGDVTVTKDSAVVAVGVEGDLEECDDPEDDEEHEQVEEEQGAQEDKVGHDRHALVT